MTLDNGNADVIISLEGCTPKTLSFSDSLTSAWTVVSAENTGIFAGATYNLDTSGGFWRTTLTYGNEIEGYAAQITWSNGWTYTPTNANEVISIQLEGECRAIAMSKDPFSGSFPLDIQAFQNGVFLGAATIGPGDNDPGGVALDWTQKTGTGNIPTYTVGVPINFYLVRRNSNELPDYTFTETTMDYRNIVLTVNVTCT